MTWEDLKDEPTEDLIEYMKCKVEASYLELAKAAYVAFNYRFRGDVEDKARKIGKNWGYDTEACDELVEEAFKRFYQYPSGFTKSKCKSSTFDVCVKLYLYRIVQNCFIDYYNKNSQSECSPYDGTEQVIVEFPTLESLELSDDIAEDYRKLRDMMSEALNTLTPKHKIIYLTYKVHEKKGFNLPGHLLKQLREVTGLKQDSIRVYKKQALATVSEYQKQNGK